ncbi:MAG: magnesium transporter [Lacipirellulaceae bacterium]
MKPFESLLRAFLDLHPEDAARSFETIEFHEALRLFKKLPNSVAASLLERLNLTVAARILEKQDTHRAVELLSAIPTRQASSLTHLMDDAQKALILESLPESEARILRELDAYAPETSGGMMEPGVVSLSIDLTAQQAIAAIRKAPREALHYLYVTNRKGELSGVLNMRDLLLAAPRDLIEPLVKRDIVAIPDTMDREEVVTLMQDRRFLALPVVDFEGRLIGVVKHDEALQAVQLEAFEDLQKIVGAGAEERAMSPVRTVVRSRLPWLFVNLLTAFMAAAVIGLFEGIIAKVAALAVLMPVVAGQGGNTGSQSLAVVMRGLALREIIPGVEKKVIRKELIGGLVNGVSIALVTAVAVFGWRILKGDPLEACTGLSLVIGLSMIVNMGTAALSGAVIPLVLKSLGRDPAQSASIFLTTVTDIVGFASFLGFAVLFSGMIM